MLLLLMLTVGLTHETVTAVSISFYATSSPFPGTGHSYTTSASPNVSMCQVEQNGLGPVDGGPPDPDVYSTACSCSNLIHSFVSEIPSPYRYLNTLTAVETLPAVKDPNYLYVGTRLQATYFYFSSLVQSYGVRHSWKLIACLHYLIIPCCPRTEY